MRGQWRITSVDARGENMMRQYPYFDAQSRYDSALDASIFLRVLEYFCHLCFQIIA
jgi:hypothetical protein